jgi:5-methylcytosine-specific restriction endonuclease McrA
MEPFEKGVSVASRCEPCNSKRKRQCSKCREWLPLDSAFHKSRNDKQGKQTWCKQCIKAYQASDVGREVFARAAAKRQHRLVEQATGVPVVEADILAECGEVCFYCSGPYVALDHMWPISKEGPHDPSNLVPTCKRCNSSKGRKHLLDFVWKVLVPEGIAP